MEHEKHTKTMVSRDWCRFRMDLRMIIDRCRSVFSFWDIIYIYIYLFSSPFGECVSSTLEVQSDRHTTELRQTCWMNWINQCTKSDPTCWPPGCQLQVVLGLLDTDHLGPAPGPTWRAETQRLGDRLGDRRIQADPSLTVHSRFPRTWKPSDRSWKICSLSYPSWYVR